MRVRSCGKTAPFRNEGCGTQLPASCGSWALLSLLLGVGDLLVFLGLLVEGAEDFAPLVVGILRQGPGARGRLPGFGEHDGVVDGDLVDEVVLGGTGEAFDDVLLLAGEPAG